MTTSRLLRCLAAGLLLAAAAGALCDDGPNQKLVQQRTAKLSKSAAAILWDAADRARAAGLFRYAREEAARVLEMDPDHRVARAFLGYVKRPEGWVVDSEARAKLPSENQPPPNGAMKLLDAEVAWRRVYALRADAAVAALYAALGDEWATKGLRAEADEAFGRALALDADNAAAHAGLGHVKLSETIWLTKDAKRALDAASVAAPVAEASRWEEIVGSPMSKAESGHFRAESPFGPASVEKSLAAAERTYAAYLADLGLAPGTQALPEVPKAVFCLVQSDEQWNRWIDRLANLNKEFSRKLALHWSPERFAVAVRNLPDATDATRCDRVRHQTAHLLDRALWSMPLGFWLDEALSYRYAVELGGSTSHYCIALRKGEYGGSAADGAVWLDASQWKALLKDMVGRNDDLPLRQIVMKNAFDLPLHASVKAWSVTDFLLRRDRAAFLGMLREIKDCKDLLGLLETRFGRNVEALDDEWRRWVLERY